MSVAFTLAEAQAWLDPPMSLSTLEREIRRAELIPLGRRFGKGRPALMYDMAQLNQVHADWIQRTDARRSKAS